MARCTSAAATYCSYSRGARARLGLAHVEQGRTVFRDLTVEENLRVAARTDELDDAYTLFPELRPRSGVAAGALSGGEQQLLVLARAMLARPQVLLIDEMSLGLAPVVVQRLLPAVRTLAAQGVAVLLVEQYAALALSIGTTAMVLFRGQIVLRSSAAELRHQTDRLHRAYLGGTDPPNLAKEPSRDLRNAPAVGPARPRDRRRVWNRRRHRATLFAAEGAAVVIADLLPHREAAEAVVASIEKDGGRAPGTFRPTSPTQPRWRRRWRYASTRSAASTRSWPRPVSAPIPGGPARSTHFWTSNPSTSRSSSTST